MDWSSTSGFEYLNVLPTFVSTSLLLSESAGQVKNGSIPLFSCNEPQRHPAGNCEVEDGQLFTRSDEDKA